MDGAEGGRLSGAEAREKVSVPFARRDLDMAGQDGAARAIKRWIESLEPGVLPLGRCAVRGGLVDDSAVTATVISVVEGEGLIEARVGVFFMEVVGGCSCGDDPAAENAYCELRLSIDRQTGEARLAPENGTDLFSI
jgi:hypothetical protein